MSSATTEDLDLRSSNVNIGTSEILDSILLATTLVLLTDLYDSPESHLDPILPQLPSLISYNLNKKRSRDDYLASSSDTPLFSSDDNPSASSAKDYNEPRVKRQHRRPCFETDTG